MHIRRATTTDIDLLVRLRLAFLGDLRPLSPETQAALTKELRAYFEKQLPGEDFRVLLGFVGDEPAATAFLVYSNYPPNDLVPGARRAMAGGIYTLPAHRRRGYASRIVAELARIAREEGAAILDLLATEAGAKVYAGLGFQTVDDAYMRLHLQGGAGG